METNTFCRLCALKSDNFMNVFKEEGIKLNLAHKIKQCLQIWLIPEDNLPKTICIDCCGKVEEYSVYFNLCSQSQVSLMEIFGGDRTEITNEVDPSEIKPPREPGEDLLSDAFEGDGDQDVTEYNVECVLSEKSPLEGTAKRKLRLPVKHSTMDGNQPNVSKAVGNAEEVQVRKARPRSKSATLKEESSDQEDDGNFDDESFNLKNSLDEYPSSNCPTLSKLEGYNWRCTDCEQELPSLAALKSHHQDVHNQPPNFKCNECTKVYTRYRSFARHVKLHGNPKKFSCDICGKCFSQKTVLQSHSTVHSEERPHVCPQCGKAFKQFSSLYLHSRCHLPDQVKPKFPCKMCPKEFSTKHTLETHIKIHTGERNFICDICGKSFIAKGSLDYHMLTHNDAKPHSCPVCGKGFKTARLLTKHSTLHTGIKPHQCDVCGKQFRERGALKEHNRIHTGAMPYSCEFCGKLFRFKGILTVHRRQHTGERPYSCAECNREFTNWANYNKHMKRRHRNNEQLTQRVVVNRQPTAVLVQAEPVVQNIGVQPMQPTTGYPDPTDHTVYKLPDEHDVYRLSSYPGALQMGTMNYYIPQIHTGVLQRNQ